MSDRKQRAVITGGAGSLGRAMADELRNHGLDVDAPGRERLDVCSKKSIEDYFNHRPLDLLVCNAGITRDTPLARLDEKQWDEVYQVNYLGALHCVKAAIPHLISKGVGHIIFVSSFSAKHPPIGQNAYASAKAALLGLTSDLSVRYGSSNIRVNAILPGYLETRMTAEVSDQRREQVLAHHALGHFNTCEQAAKFVRFLHLEMPHTSGQHFQLDSRLDKW